MSIVRGILKKIPGLRNLHYRYLDFVETQRLKGKSPETIFNEIYLENRWGSHESKSGTGSSADQTKEVVRNLPEVLKRLSAVSMLDIPCGDFHWMRTVDLSGISYTGGDIVASLAVENATRYESDGIAFRKLDLLKDDLPEADLVFCRDCFVHLSFSDIFIALRNISASGSKFLMTTTFTEVNYNENIITGKWRPINLLAAPFNFPQPLIEFNEGCTEGDGSSSDKSMAVWRISDLVLDLQGGAEAS